MAKIPIVFRRKCFEKLYSTLGFSYDRIEAQRQIILGASSYYSVSDYASSLGLTRRALTEIANSVGLSNLSHYLRDKNEFRLPVPYPFEERSDDSENST